MLEAALDVHLIDGTYELFRHYYALPSARDQDGREIAAVRGVLASVLGMIKIGATHIAVATDHVIESFRNGLWPGYKTGAGIDADLLAQFPLLEEVLSAAGIIVWAMVEYEADDALAAGAAAANDDKRVEHVIICTPDKDLAQCVRGTRVVQLDRRTRVTRDEPGVVQKFGVSPRSIPDYLALVGDAADGYPGAPGWGAKSSAAVLAKFAHIESIPKDWRDWHAANAANASVLANTLSVELDQALLFRTLCAALRTDIRLFADVEQLRWNGPASSDALAARFDAAITETKRPKGRKSGRLARSSLIYFAHDHRRPMSHGRIVGEPINGCRKRSGTSRSDWRLSPFQPSHRPSHLSKWPRSNRPSRWTRPKSLAALQSGGKLPVGLTIDSHRAENTLYLDLKTLLTYAYGVKPYQITGPDWMSTTRFNIVAKMPEGSTKEDAPQMLQSLLEERFKLTTHRTSAERIRCWPL